MKSTWYVVMGMLALAAVLVVNHAAGVAEERQEDAAVVRARKTVKMLDDVYKTTVVLITDKYVEDESDFPAGAAAIALFDAISKKGWHEVRLIDVSGEPYDEKNVARDAFERQAVEKMKAGESYYDEVEQGEGGKAYLRAMTPVPVVMQKCVMCHPNYEQAAKGAAIGALSYRIPLE